MEDKAKAQSVVTSGLVCGSRPEESALAVGKFTVQCFDKDGNLKLTVRWISIHTT